MISNPEHAVDEITMSLVTSEATGIEYRVSNVFVLESILPSSVVTVLYYISFFSSALALSWLSRIFFVFP